MMKNPKIDLASMTITVEVEMIENGKNQPYHLTLFTVVDPIRPVMKGNLEGYPEIVIELPKNLESEDVEDFDAPANMTKNSKEKILKAIVEFLNRMYA